ncbi:MDR family oxidoreductase [Yokenella regensburgei]|uniref:acrylyl-CoA reductase (NADPH) n=1 Tax=Yokenella regensburgei TaxID=158877 RepID=UPI0031DD43F7
MFNAILINKSDAGYDAQYTSVAQSDLPEGHVTVAIDYSSINYKDALAITGRGPIVRQFPMVPGIDFAGTVTESSDDAYRVGDKVLLTGWGVGERHWGGLAQKARVKSEWLTRLPEGASPQTVMAIGTAGFTAMLCVNALLKQGITPQMGPVLVTGASGGVGSCAAIILRKLGYDVIASSGRPEKTAQLLAKWGVKEIIHRDELGAPGKPLQKERWAAAVDTVGSHTLFNACAGTKYNGVVAACGMAQGMDFPANVAPFILRGVTLRGVDSVMVSQAVREETWRNVCRYLTADDLAGISVVKPLSTAIATAEALLAGQVHGRVVIDCNK